MSNIANNDMSFTDVLDIIKKDEITASDILKFVNVKHMVNPDGSFTVKPNKWTLHSKIILNRGDVVNLKSTIETTIGRAIINNIIKISPFGAFFDYENERIFINNFINIASGHLLRGTLTTEQVSKLINNAVWLTRFSDMVIPSVSRKVLVTPESAKTLRVKLEKENEEVIKNGDITYVTKVEAPVLAEILDNIKDDPSYMLFHTGKPSVKNHLKQLVGTFSPIFNPVTGKYDIQTGNLTTGHSSELYNSLANMNITGTYARNIDTQNGGSIVKTIYNSMYNMKAAPAGSDCRAVRYKTVKLSKSNINIYMWSYIAEANDVLVLLTPDNKSKYIDTVQKFRSALYCRYEKRFEICNKCAGEIPYRTGLLSIGLLSAKLGFSTVNSSLKQFHDSTVTLTNFDIFDYMKIAK